MSSGPSSLRPVRQSLVCFIAGVAELLENWLHARALRQVLTVSFERSDNLTDPVQVRRRLLLTRCRRGRWILGAGARRSRTAGSRPSPILLGASFVCFPGGGTLAVSRIVLPCIRLVRLLGILIVILDLIVSCLLDGFVDGHLRCV